MKNNMCDGDKCKSEKGEVRVLPTGEDSNGILCYDCYLHEIRYRRDFNRQAKADNTGVVMDLPKWEDLKVYNGV